MPADSTSATTPRTSFQSLLRQRGSWVTAKRTFSPASTDSRSSVSFWVSTPVVSSRAARKPLEISSRKKVSIPNRSAPVRRREEP